MVHITYIIRIISVFVFLVSIFGIAKPWPLDALLDRIPAVHATAIFPQNGRLEVGQVVDIRSGQLTDLPAFRPTLHFALGALINDLEESNHYSYAIILPLRSLLPQLLNIHVYDTFTLGGVELPEGTVILSLRNLEDLPRVPSGIEVKYVNPQHKSLREAVEEEISSRRYIEFDLVKQNGMFLFQPAFFEGKNVNTPEFFSPILEHYPHISFGSHTFSLKGQAGFFGNLDQFIRELILNNYALGAKGLPTLAVESWVLNIKRVLVQLQTWVEAQNFPSSSLSDFNSAVMKMESYIKPLEVDVMLRKSLGLSFQGFIDLRNDDNLNMISNTLSILAENVYQKSPASGNQVDPVEWERLKSTLNVIFNSMPYLWDASTIHYSSDLDMSFWSSLMFNDTFEDFHREYYAITEIHPELRMFTPKIRLRYYTYRFLIEKSSEQRVKLLKEIKACTYGQEPADTISVMASVMGHFQNGLYLPFYDRVNEFVSQSKEFKIPGAHLLPLVLPLTGVAPQTN